MFSNLFAGSQKQSAQPELPVQNSQATQDHGLTRQTTNESYEGEHIDLFANVRDTPVAAWHIRGNNQYFNDEQYRKLVEEANAVMFSSIM